MNIGLMSLSGHKIYGPKGVGALYIRRRTRIKVEPQINRGGRERRIRSGTVPTPLVVGFRAACELAMKEMEYDDQRIKALQERLLNGISSKIDGVVINRSVERRYAGNLNLSFAYVEAINTFQFHESLENRHLLTLSLKRLPLHSHIDF
ncbi:Cysteine desulfurase, mitochondrial [Capsicum baccatum]|uniref:cysteine desulfurase n=1 Tax=Capsicum baccatum TaxID=33114 RepID=A0A2G2WCR1_CAPBA|nr:Cysteine desulfurase, mitochondrial [Capsicum baccatum]